MKKVAIVENGWGSFISYAWIDGCKRYIAEHNLDVNIYTFNSFGDYNQDHKFNVGEYNILNLPDFSEFDGIILELTNIAIPEFKSAIIEKVIAAKIPAISLVEEVPGFYYAGIDNYAAMTEMVEHIISAHGAQVLNFIGGPEDSMENQLRLKAYKDALRRHNITVDPNRIYQGDFTIQTGIHGFLNYLGKKMLPDAFICANDNIAVGLTHEAQRLGYNVPDDFMVTGFDNFDKASYYSPRISTIGFTREDIAYSAMEMLDQIWSGKENIERNWAKTTCIYQESCGCYTAGNVKTRGQYVVDRIFADDRQDSINRELQLLKRALINCNSFTEMANCLPPYLYNFEFDDMYIVVNKELLDDESYVHFDDPKESNYRIEGYPDDMLVLLATNKNGVIDNVKWHRKTLVPGGADRDSGNLFLFSPLHFRDREIGYIVFKNCDALMGSTLLANILTVFLECMETLYQRTILNRMNQELSRLYLKDSLTGLYNRMAYSKLTQPAYDRCIAQHMPCTILFLDMDGLKYVNDNFGHDMGNLAITTISAAIDENCPENGIAMRYGGDEFIMLLPGCNEAKALTIIDEIQHNIEVRSATLDVTFPIGVSIGYEVATSDDMSLNDCINKADASMYAVKNEKKAHLIRH